MRIKGLEKFREKVPKFSGKRIIIVPICMISMLFASIIILLIFDLLPLIMPTEGLIGYLRPWFPIFGVIIVGTIGLLSVFQMWHRRDRLKAKYGQLSYQKVILVGLGGVAFIIGLAIHTFIPFYFWDLTFWSQFPFSIFTTPLTSYIPVITQFFEYMRLFLGVFIGVLGYITLVRALFTFGIDYMTVVYLYFPEESELQNHKIYSVLRHPTYAGLLIMSFGGMIFHLTLYSIIFFLILFTGIFIHIHFVEEKELITRFGDSYKEYKNQVPAVLVKPKNWGQYFKFLLGKE